MDREQEELWLPVIGKCLATLAMQRSELANSDIVARAAFLEGLGVPRSDVAAMLGSTVDSLRVMLRRQKKKGGKRRGSQKKG
jgi:hypothetical protein